MNIASLP